MSGYFSCVSYELESTAPELEELAAFPANV